MSLPTLAELDLNPKQLELIRNGPYLWLLAAQDDDVDELVEIGLLYRSDFYSKDTRYYELTDHGRAILEALKSTT